MSNPLVVSEDKVYNANYHLIKRSFDPTRKNKAYKFSKALSTQKLLRSNILK